MYLPYPFRHPITGFLMICAVKLPFTITLNAEDKRGVLVDGDERQV